MQQEKTPSLHGAATRRVLLSACAAVTIPWLAFVAGVTAAAIGAITGCHRPRGLSGCAGVSPRRRCGNV